MKVFLIVLASVVGFLLLVGYAMYHATFIRGGNPGTPKSGKGKNDAKRFFNDNYADGIQFLEEWGYETLTIMNFQGKQLVGYLFHAVKPTDKIALCFHGFRNTAFHEFLYHTKMYLVNLGMDVLIVDNKAHGASDGTRIGFSWNDRKDCIQWTRWIQDNLGPDKQVLLQGISMGAATVLSAAGEPEIASNVKWIVSDCSFSNLKRELIHVMKRTAWMPPIPFYYILSGYCKVFNGFRCSVVDIEKRVKNIKVPVLFIHGGADKFVPTEMVYVLYEACSSPKELMIVPEAKHGESFLLAPVEYEQAIARLMTIA